jgi:hypothetical protein
VKAVAEKGATSFTASYRLSKGLIHSSHNDDYADHFAALKAKFGLTTRLNIDAWADYNKTHDSRGTTFTGAPIFFNTPDRYHETVVGSKISYGVRGRIDVKGIYTNKRYDNHHTITQVLDLDTVGSSLAFSFPIAPKTSAVLEVRYNIFNYKFFSPAANLDSSEQSFFGGLNWKAANKTTGRVRLGYLKKNFLSPLSADFSQFAWELNVLWKPLAHASWRLSSSYYPQETDGTGSFSQSLNVNLKWKHRWSRYLSHKASIGYTEDKFHGLASQRKDRVVLASLSLDYDLFRWLTVGAGYDFTNRNSNALNASYRDNVWSFRLLGTL